MAFQSGDEAFERRGYAAGMRKVLQTVQEIYADSHKQVTNVSTSSTDPRERAESIVRSLYEYNVRNPADKPATGPAY